MIRTIEIPRMMSPVKEINHKYIEPSNISINVECEVKEALYSDDYGNNIMWVPRLIVVNFVLNDHVIFSRTFIDDEMMFWLEALEAAKLYKLQTEPISRKEESEHEDWLRDNQ
jgi:hypothetical protein